MSANIWRNVSILIGRNLILQQDNDPKHTANTTKDFIMEKKWKVFEWPSQLPDTRQSLNPIEYAFHLLKRQTTMSRRLDAVIVTCLMFIYLSQPQIYSVYYKNKGIGLAVPILLEGNICWITSYMFRKEIISSWHSPLLYNRRQLFYVP